MFLNHKKINNGNEIKNTPNRIHQSATLEKLIKIDTFFLHKEREGRIDVVLKTLLPQFTYVHDSISIFMESKKVKDNEKRIFQYRYICGSSTAKNESEKFIICLILIFAVIYNIWKINVLNM